MKEVYDKKSHAYYHRNDACNALPVALYCKEKIGCKQSSHEKHEENAERLPEMAVKDGFFEEFFFGFIFVFKKYGHEKTTPLKNKKADTENETEIKLHSPLSTLHS